MKALNLAGQEIVKNSKKTRLNNKLEILNLSHVKYTKRS